MRHRVEWNALMKTLRLVQFRARISLFPPALFEGPYIWAVIKYPVIIISEQCVCACLCVWLRRPCPTSFNILLVIQLCKVRSDRQALV